MKFLLSFRSLLLAGAASCVALAPLSAQVRPLQTRDMTRLSQLQVTEYLKRNDTIYIAIGSVETSGMRPSNVDWVHALGYCRAAAEATDSLFMPGLMWSYPGTTMNGSSTINITPSQGIDFLRATCLSLLRQGFRRQILISVGHGPAMLTAGLVAREFFDEYRVPIIFIDMSPTLARLNIPPESRTRVNYGLFALAGHLIDMPLKGDYGPDADTSPIPENPGLQALGQLGYSGSDRLGSWVADPRAHGGGGGGPGAGKGGGAGKKGGGAGKKGGGGGGGAFDAGWPATAEEREAWAKEGIAQVQAIVKAAKFDEVMVALKQHDDFTNKVIGPKYDHILPPKGR
jgi:creatinine amidohydrolase